MENRWFKNAIIYCVEVDTFRDGNLVASILQKSSYKVANLLMRFCGLFGLVCRSFCLHIKNLTTRGVDANFLGVFRSGLRDINGPEALSSCRLQFRATNAATSELC